MVRYPIPNKKDLLDRLNKAVIFSKFDLKSGYWQIQIQESDRYKTAFAVPFGHYEWNVMPFGLKNAPSEFQNIMNDIFYPHADFAICYIDNVLIFSENIDQHVKHLRIFKDVIKRNGLVVSAPKMKLFQTKVRFLGHNINQGKIIPIDRSIEFASKFPDEIRDKTQLQRFLGSLNYIGDYYKELAQDSAPLYDMLKKNPPPWTEQHTKAVRKIELKAQRKKENKSPVKNPFLEYSALIRAKHPDLSNDEVVIKTMDYMKEQFLQTVQPSQNIADDVSMTSAKSNEDDNNPFSCLAGESQDPYEDEGTTPTLGDLWDSMTELMAEQLSSRKGKEKQ